MGLVHQVRPALFTDTAELGRRCHPHYSVHFSAFFQEKSVFFVAHPPLLHCTETAKHNYSKCERNCGIVNDIYLYPFVHRWWGNLWGVGGGRAHKQLYSSLMWLRREGIKDNVMLICGICESLEQAGDKKTGRGKSPPPHVKWGKNETKNLFLRRLWHLTCKCYGFIQYVSKVGVITLEYFYCCCFNSRGGDSFFF